MNVREPATGDQNYKVPDVIFVSKAREGIIQGRWVEGGPDVVFEIRSPDDETYEKFPFYALVGVPTLVVLRGTRRSVEVYRLERGSYVALDPDASGRVPIDVLGVTLREAAKGGKPALEVASTFDDASTLVVPLG